jgi:diguanylate cyclase (GGDEF)-like protein
VEIGGQATRIFIVDRDKAAARTLAVILEAKGYVVHEAEDLNSAGALLKSISPDLLMVSLAMDLNFVKEVRNQNRDVGSVYPIVGLGAGVSTAVKRQALEFGVSDFLTSPYDAVEVEARVKSLLHVRDLHKRTQYLATHDPLTRCVNRTALIDFFSREVERHKRFKKPFSFLLLDLDGFVSINKELGQPIGDLALTHVGYRLQDFFRAVDCVARLDGDEFAAVLPDCGLSSAMKVGDRIMSDLLPASGRPPLPKSLKGRIHYSVGISCAPDHGDDIETLFQAAEKALSAVKKAGGGAFRLYRKK